MTWQGSARSIGGLAASAGGLMWAVTSLGGRRGIRSVLDERLLEAPLLSLGSPEPGRAW